MFSSSRKRNGDNGNSWLSSFRWLVWRATTRLWRGTALPVKWRMDSVELRCSSSPHSDSQAWRHPDTSILTRSWSILARIPCLQTDHSWVHSSKYQKIGYPPCCRPTPTEPARSPGPRSQDCPVAAAWVLNCGFPVPYSAAKRARDVRDCRLTSPVEALGFPAFTYLFFSAVHPQSVNQGTSVLASTVESWCKFRSNPIPTLPIFALWLI